MENVKMMELPWLVIREVPGDWYVSARFLIRDAAEAYVHDRLYGKYHIVYEPDAKADGFELVKI